MKKRKLVATHVAIKLFSDFQSSTNPLISLVANARSENNSKKKQEDILVGEQYQISVIRIGKW